jgi:hypothetical protein
LEQRALGVLEVLCRTLPVWLTVLLLLVTRVQQFKVQAAFQRCAFLNSATADALIVISTWILSGRARSALRDMSFAGSDSASECSCVAHLALLLLAAGVVACAMVACCST